MKKLLTAIIIVMLIAVVLVVFYLNVLKSDKASVTKFNKQFEMYKGQQSFGNEVVTAINKAIENNGKYKIEKDENEEYKDDGKNSIKIDVIFIKSVKDDGTLETVTYPMENIAKLGINEFLSNYGLILFECSDIKYHEETGLVSKLVFSQVRQNI